MNDIKARMKSVTGTMQITKAMELVANSKLRRAKERVEKSRPYYEILRKAIASIESSGEIDSPFNKKRDANKSLVIVIAGDRGLAGGYNSNVFKLAERVASKNTSFLPIGKKALEYFRHRNKKLFSDSADITADVGVGDCLALGEAITSAYLNGEMLTFDSYGILKESRTFVPLRFIAEMLSCDVDWNDSTKTVVIKSAGEAVKFPEPQITVHYPESKDDKRMFWITLDNYREFQRNCPYYEFKIEFTNPVEFNTYEQDEGAINGWQKYDRTNFYPLTASYNTIISVGRAFYTTRANKATCVPKDGDQIEFKLTVLRKCSNETREYTFNETLKLPYPLIEVEE